MARDDDDDEPKLKLSAVRERAMSVPGCKELSTGSDIDDDDDDDDDPRVVSFLVDRSDSVTTGGNEGRSVATTPGVARVNVYYQTGTVGTCRVLNGEVREIFRKHTSLDALERILRHPPTLVSIDERLVSLDDINEEYSTGRITDGRSAADDLAASEDAKEVRIRKDIELADVGLAILISETEKLSSHLQSLGDGENEGNGQGGTGGSNESVYDVFGGDSRATDRREFAYHLPAETISHIEDCLADSTRDPITCIASSGPGTVLIYRSGEWAYTSDIPKPLYRILKGRQRSLPPPSYVSLGKKGRFYILFRDGKSEWSGPKALGVVLRRNSSRGVRSVAFGAKRDTFFVVFGDGSWEYQGDGIPSGLEEKLQARGEVPDLACCTLGPEGEWFLKAKNGRMWWGEVSEELDDLMDELKEDGRIPCFLDFGEFGSYFVAHD